MKLVIDIPSGYFNLSEKIQSGSIANKIVLNAVNEALANYNPIESCETCVFNTNRDINGICATCSHNYCSNYSKVKDDV